MSDSPPTSVHPTLIAAQLTDRNRRLVRADGTVQYFAEPITIDAIHALIGADTVDNVVMRHAGRPMLVMILNDRGYEVEVVEHPPAPNPDMGGMTASVIERKPTRALLPVNDIATALYHANCIPGTTHQIVGDVFIAPDEDFA